MEARRSEAFLNRKGEVVSSYGGATVVARRDGAIHASLGGGHSIGSEARQADSFPGAPSLCRKHRYNSAIHLIQPLLHGTHHERIVGSRSARLKRPVKRRPILR